MRQHSLRAIHVIVGLANLAIMGGFALNLAGVISPESASLLVQRAVGEFDLQSGEPVLATWYSASLTVAVAVVATINYWVDQVRSSVTPSGSRFLRYGWLLLAIGTLYISVDETIELHERVAWWLSGSQQIEVGELTASSPIFLWLVFLAPILLAVGLLLLGFFVRWLAVAPSARALAIAGIAFWLAVPVFEYLEFRAGTAFGIGGASVTRFFEESLELWGATLLLFGAAEYLVARLVLLGVAGPIPSTPEPEPVPSTTAR